MTFTKRRRELTGKETEWLKAHFKNTKNADITERLGISHSHLQSLARELGLKKTKQFVRKMQHNAALCATAAVKRMEREDPERFRRIRETGTRNLIEAGKEHRFIKGVRTPEESPEQKARRLAKATATREQRRNRDRARAAIGLKPLTRLALGVPSEGRTKRYQSKWHLCRYYGYVAGEGLTVYYTEETRRSRYEYLYTERHGFKFVPYGQKAEQPRRVTAIADWSDKQGGFNTL